MKVIKDEGVTIIYPLNGPDPANEGLAKLVVRPEGMIKLWVGKQVITVEEAQALGKALLHAAQLVQNGQK